MTASPLPNTNIPAFGKENEYAQQIRSLQTSECSWRGPWAAAQTATLSAITNRMLGQSTKTPSEVDMSKVVYISKSSIERKRGPLRVARLPGELQPVVYSVHGAIAEHYKLDPAKLTESHASTIDYVISATAG